MIRVANAPCSWGVLEFETVTTPAPFGQVLDEIRETGYSGTELGDWGFMPTEPAHLASEIAKRDLRLMAAFVPVAFALEDTHAQGAETAIRTARLLREVGGSDALIVLSDDNGTVLERVWNAGRIGPGHGLVDREWQVFAHGVERVARAVREETELRTVFHPHCGGYVETMPEIDELMGRTDPALVGLCLDTGHIMFGGGDPLDVFDRHARRTWHVHFKDCDPDVAQQSRAAQRSYLQSVGAGVFCELGAGAVDFAAIIGALKQRDYDGWIVVEQDVFPGYGTPAESARRSRAYLRSLGL